jgi:quinol monooxygenase YgiN
MLIRIVRLTFREGSVSDFLNTFQESSELIRAANGCRGVRLLRDTDNPNVFFTISHWEGREHLRMYRESELFRNTWARTKVLFASPPIAHSAEDTGL